MTARENLHFFLSRDFGNGGNPPVLDETGWQELIALAHATKTLGLLERGVGKAGVVPPAAYAQQLGTYRTAILQINLRNIQALAEIARQYAADDIPFLVVKGTFRAEQVYGAADLRYGADIDLLVRKTDYRRSIRALEALDYRCLVPKDDRWWHDFLGEAPFRKKTGSGASIDLHNQVQQPGGPYPPDLDAFFRSAAFREIGSLRVAIPCPRHALMITAISFGKALRGGEAWIQYAHEFATVWQGLTPEVRADMQDCAKGMGLDRLFAQFAASACCLFDIPGAARSATSRADFQHLLRSAFAEQPLGMFGRTRATWRWMPGGFFERPRQFGTALIHELRSRAAYRNSPEPELS